MSDRFAGDDDPIPEWVDATTCRDDDRPRVIANSTYHLLSPVPTPMEPEPTPGTPVDWVVLAAGVVCLTLIVVSIAVAVWMVLCAR